MIYGSDHVTPCILGVMTCEAHMRQIYQCQPSASRSAVFMAKFFSMICAVQECVEIIPHQVVRYIISYNYLPLFKHTKRKDHSFRLVIL